MIRLPEDKKDRIRVRGCLTEGCGRPYGCERCGWNVEEDARRKQIPLTEDERGLLRKVIPGKIGEEGIA